MRYLRAAGVAVLLRDLSVPDGASILRGELDLQWETATVAVSSLDEGELHLSPEQIGVLAAASAYEAKSLEALAAAAGVDPEVGRRLVDAGLLVPESSEEARRSAQILDSQWHPFAALYHRHSGWRDVHERVSLPEEREELLALVETSPEAFSRFIETHGPPPSTFVSRPDAVSRTPLPEPQEDGELFRLLSRRRTTRLFDPDRPLTGEHFSTLLWSVFGARGLKELAPGFHGVKRTSPSGGGLHPIETYVLTLRVEGIEPGLHHYSTRDHGLETLRTFALSEAEDLAHELTAGQSFAREAGALFLLTGRFERTFWKYRRHAKAYKVFLLEVGHFSQTLYLVAEELGLGAFFAGAMNDRNAEEHLGLDTMEEGVLGLLGCGHPRSEGYAITLDPEPYDPFRSRG